MKITDLREEAVPTGIKSTEFIEVEVEMVLTGVNVSTMT
jgi:hypothetical protein